MSAPVRTLPSPNSHGSWPRRSTTKAVLFSTPPGRTARHANCSTYPDFGHSAGMRKPICVGVSRRLMLISSQTAVASADSGKGHARCCARMTDLVSLSFVHLRHYRHDQESGTHYRRHRPGWRIPCRDPAQQGIRRSRHQAPSSFNTARVDHLYADPHESNVRSSMHYGDMTDATNLIRIIQETKPSEIYNLAAQSHVQVSFETPEYTANADALGTLRLLEAVRILEMRNTVRFYQASTSELYGSVRETPQRETTPFYPRSPYAAAKLYAYWITVNYREAYGIHASNGILFNHEGPTRGETFVTRKITRAVAAIEFGIQDKLYLGNLDAKRDWGHARDYVEGMWLIVQQPEPDDYVLATGEIHSVREFVEQAFAYVGRRIAWRGTGVGEQGIDAATGRVLVEIDPRYFRPTEVEMLLGDSSKAREKLGWRHKVSFEALVSEMVAADLQTMRVKGLDHYDFDLSPTLTTEPAPVDG